MNATSAKWAAINARLYEGAMKQRAHTRRVLNDDKVATLRVYNEMKLECFAYGVPTNITIDELKQRVIGERMRRTQN